MKLKDIKQNGKEKNWRGKKIGSRILHRSYKRLGYEAKASRVYQCGDVLDFKADPNNPEDKKLYRAYFCMSPLCPVCAMRRSDKLYGQTQQIMNHIKKDKYRYVFLTLTIKNMAGEDLKGAIDDLMKGFNLMTKRKEFKALSKGWMRSLEITHNWANNEYHPHLHMIIAVDERYFTEYENYLNHGQWLSLWKSCMKLDYDPWVRVNKVRRDKEKGEKGEIKYEKAVSEITKYAVKSTHYMVIWKNRDKFKKETGVTLRDQKHADELTDRVVSVLTAAMYHRRLVAFGGCMKEAHKLLNLDDPVEGDLINTDSEKEKSDGVYTILVRYRWSNKHEDYILDKEVSGLRVEMVYGIPPEKGYLDAG
jgi:plasmid rolling circle replication initiator protein Rep